MKRDSQTAVRRSSGRILPATMTLLAGICASLLLSGCVMVGASSRGGFFIWPGSLGLLLILLVLFLLLRRR